MEMAVIRISSSYYLAVCFINTNEPSGEIVLTRRKFKKESEQEFRQRVKKAAAKEGITNIIGL